MPSRAYRTPRVLELKKCRCCDFLAQPQPCIVNEAAGQVSSSKGCSDARAPWVQAKSAMRHMVGSIPRIFFVCKQKFLKLTSH